MEFHKDIKTIVVSGPESTGKTTLSKRIAGHYNAIYYPEFARAYVSQLNRPYEYRDLVRIAEKQVEDFFYRQQPKDDKLNVFDTGLIITKVWFEVVYSKVPDFIYEALNKLKIDLYLLCYPDIPWIPDGIRENGGEKRMELFEKYRTEIELYQFDYIIIKGNEDERFLTAKQYIDSAHSL